MCVCGPLLASAPQLLQPAIPQGSHGAQHPYRLQCNASDEKAWCQQDIRTFLAPSPGRSRWPSPAPPTFNFLAFCCWKRFFLNHEFYSRTAYRDSVFLWICRKVFVVFSALTLLVGWQEGYPDCKKTEWRDAGPADATALTVSCFSKIQIGFTFLVLAHRVVPDRGPLNGCVCVCCREVFIPVRTSQKGVKMQFSCSSKQNSKTNSTTVQWAHVQSCLGVNENTIIHAANSHTYHYY